MPPPQFDNHCHTQFNNFLILSLNNYQHNCLIAPENLFPTANRWTLYQESTAHSSQKSNSLHIFSNNLPIHYGLVPCFKTKILYSVLLSWLTSCLHHLDFTLQISHVVLTLSSFQFGTLLSPEYKAQQKCESASPYLNVKSCSFGLTPLKGSQSMNLQLPSGSNKFSIFRKPNHGRPNSSVGANPEEAYDGLGGHSKVDIFPIPSTKFKPTNKKLKPISISKTKKQVTVSNKLEMFFDSTWIYDSSSGSCS